MIEKIKEYHENKIYHDENGKESTLKEQINDKFKDEMIMIDKLYEMFKENPMSLELYDFEFLRKRKFKRNPNDVKLEFDSSIGGYVMITKERDKVDIIRGLSPDTKSALLDITTYMNKDGVLIYDGNYAPIKSFDDLRSLLKISTRKWRVVVKELKDSNLLRKGVSELRSGGNILIVNPFFLSKSRTIDSLKFINFNEFFKEKFDEIDYYYLCKKFEINLSMWA